MDLMREVDGIGSKMLSKELQDMEMNRLIIRTVLYTKPINVEYELTDYGHTLRDIVKAMSNWGIEYRNTLYGIDDD